MKSIIAALLLFCTGTAVYGQSSDYLSEIKAPMHWDYARNPIRVSIDTSGKGYKPAFSDVIKESFGDWQNAVSPLLKFQFIDSGDGDIICLFTDKREDMQSVLEDGNTVLVPSDKGIVSGTITFLTVPPLGQTEVSRPYFKHIALHEIGHVLGLGGHSSQTADIMYGVIKPGENKAALSARDIATLKTIYEKKLNATPEISLPQGDSPAMKALRANNEAAIAMKDGKYDVALQKYIDGHMLDPANKMITRNLAGLYANFGTLAMLQRNPVKAEEMYRKGIALYEGDSESKGNLLKIYNACYSVLMMQGKQKEADAIQEKMKAVLK